MNRFTKRGLDKRRRSAIAYLRENPDNLTQVTGSLWSGNGYYCAVGALAKHLGVSNTDIKSRGYSVVEDRLRVDNSALIWGKNDAGYPFAEIADWLEKLWFPKED